MSIERARAAGLMSKHNWVHHPADMLVARGSGQICRILWPDIVSGLVSVEEAYDGDFIDAEYTDKPAFSSVPPPAAPVDPEAPAPKAETKPAPESIATPRRDQQPRVTDHQRVTRPPRTPPPAERPHETMQQKEDRLQASIDEARRKMDERLAAEAAAAAARPSTPDDSSTAAPTSTSSGSPGSTTTATSSSAPAPDPVEDFGEEAAPEEVRAPVIPEAKSFDAFKAWAAACRTQAHLDDSKPIWVAWSKRHASPQEAASMREIFAKRKAELP